MMRRIPGFFGKLPSLGDFVSRELPSTFIKPWDGWLQRAVTCSRQQLGEHWLEVYLVSPMWRFALNAQVCGPEPWAGVVMPSVDRVGRYFPLTVAVPLSADSALLPMLECGAPWYERVEGVLREVLEEETCEVDALGARLAALGAPPMFIGPAGDAGTIGEAEAYHITLSTGGLASVPEVLEPLLRRRWNQHSLWWSTGSAMVDPSVLICTGLPPAQGYAAMLDGQWQGEWREWPV